MFADAILEIDRYTRSVHFISRFYGGNSITPGSATLFFVNDDACAVTCKHVVQQILIEEAVHSQYINFKSRFSRFLNDPSARIHRKRLLEEVGVEEFSLARTLHSFPNCVEHPERFVIHTHPVYDLAIIRFLDYGKKLYSGHARFLPDESAIRQGKYLCRLGYPFPEFTNYQYNSLKDDIEWTASGRQFTPNFPVDGIITRHIADQFGIHGIEMSTPGLRGQSGGPLFDSNGLVYGIQSSTRHLHLGFDQIEKEVVHEGHKKRVSNFPFMNVGQCIHLSIVKQFLRENEVEFLEA